MGDRKAVKPVPFQGRRVYYGWVLVAMEMSVFAVVSGAVYYTFGIFLEPIIDEMGWSRGTTATAFSILTVINGLSGPVVALMTERIGPRRTMLTGQALLVAGLLLLTRITALWQLYLLYGVVVTFAMSCTTYVCATALLTRWFVRRRSLAMGIAMAGSGLGTMVLAPVGHALITSVGWRAAWAVMAGLVVVIAIAPTWLLARDDPGKMGLQPDGLPIAPSGNPGRASVKAPDWPMAAAFKTRALWLIALMAFANLFSLSMVTSHQVVHLEDNGIDALAAASALGLMVGMSSLGRVLGGAAGQWLPLRYVGAASAALEALGIMVLLFAHNLPLVYVYVLTFGLGYGMLVILFPSMVAAYFGPRHYARIFGAAFAVVSILGAAAPAFAGFMFDATGSYTLPFSIAAGLLGCATLGCFMARVPARTPAQDRLRAAR